MLTDINPTTIVIFFFLPLWILGGAILVITTYLHNRRLAKSGIAEIDKMNGKAFEDYLTWLFQKMGYKVSPTPYAGDYGADLIIEKDGIKTAVQAKRYKGKVGIEAIQQVVADEGEESCSGCHGRNGVPAP